MAKRSIAGPIIMLVIGFSLVLFSVSGVVGIGFEEIISVWADNFGNFMSTWGEGFGEFMSAWGESFGAFLTSLVSAPSLQTLRIFGGAAMLIVGLAIIIASLKGFRR